MKKWTHPEFERIRADYEARANAAMSPFLKRMDEEIERTKRAAGWVPDAPDENAPAPDGDAIPSRERKDCLRDAMESAFDVLETELSRPPNRSEMWGYLTQRDTSGYITGSSPDLISWRDWDGNKHTANKRNISERLRNIRKSRNG